MNIDISPIWSTVAGLYFVTAVYYQIAYRSDVSNYATAAHLFIGFAIIALVESRIRVTPDFYLVISELAVIVAVVAAWALSTLAIREHITTNRGLRN